MAGFCRNCGNPLADAQAFCTKCGTRVGEVSPQPQSAVAPSPTQAPPVAPAAPSVAAAPVVAPAKTGGGGTVLKILLAVVLVLFFFGAAGIASMMYIAYRVRQKAREMGINSHTFEQHKSTLSTTDVCALLPKEAVTQAIGVEVVRAEADPGSNPGCAYFVKGDAADLTAKHISQLHKKDMNKSQQETIENFGKAIFQGGAGQSGSAPSATEHPGEATVLVFNIDENAAALQIKLNRGALAGLGPMATSNIPDLGDEAFDAAGAMLIARKGDKLLRITYTTCPCDTDAVISLARKLLANL